MTKDGWDDLIGHVVRTTRLDPGTARRVVEDVATYFGETAEVFVRRRHRELQARGVTNDAIFARIIDELSCRPVAAPALSTRQVRRMVYG